MPADTVERFLPLIAPAPPTPLTPGSGAVSKSRLACSSAAAGPSPAAPVSASILAAMRRCTDRGSSRTETATATPARARQYMVTTQVAAGRPV